MKKAALLVCALFVGFAMVGCKSDVEKAADATCACADKKPDEAKKCLEDVSAQFKDKGPKTKEDADKLSDSDKKAMERSLDCSKKAMGFGK